MLESSWSRILPDGSIEIVRVPNTRPDLKRRFRVPGGSVRINGVWNGVIPAVAIVFCILILAPLLVDLVDNALRGDNSDNVAGWLSAADVRPVDAGELRQESV